MTWLFSKALMDQSGNSLCSQVQAAESSVGSCSVGEPSAALNVMPTAQPFWLNDKTTDRSNLSRFGLTSRVLTENDGEAVLMSFLEAFPVRTYPSPERGMDSMEIEAVSGVTSRESLARYDRDSRMWKTRQLSLFEDSIEFSETFPRWGSTQNGELFQEQTPSGLKELRALINYASESGSLERMPTMNKCKAGNDISLTCSGDGRQKPNKLGWAVATTLRMPTMHGFSKDGTSNGPSGNELGRAVNKTMRDPTMTKQCAKNNGSKSQQERNTPPLDAWVGGSLNPMWCEWFMGSPIGWTDLQPLETSKFQQWLHSHGKYCLNEGTEQH